MRNLVWIIILVSTLSACGSDEVVVMGGSLELNQKLRADLERADSMPNGRFFANGECAGGSTAQDECHYVSAVLASMMDAENRLFTNRLRRAPFLWVEGDGFAELSYEFLGRGVNIALKDDPTEIIATDVDVGTCHGFPVANPDTRVPIEELEDVDEETSDAYTQMFEVTVHECAANGTGNPETLVPQSTNCSDRTVRSFLGNNPPGNPQNWPLCLVSLGASQLSSDVSFSLIPGTTQGVDLLDVWPGLIVPTFQLTPHLRTVPIGGVRTISRLMERTGQRRTNDDGSVTHWFEWRVRLGGSEWTENFSPNVIVARARVRRGAWSPNNRDYLNLEALEVGNVRCQVRVPGSGDTEFDIPMCNPSLQGGFRVSPGYRYETLLQQRVDDNDRLLWDARVQVPRTPLNDNDQLYLELDLTAINPIGTSGSGLMADPGGRDLGSIRTGQTTVPQPGFMLYNIGSVSAWVESITLTGANAAEFGTVQIQRVSAPGTGSSSAAPATFSAPFIFLAGSRAEVKLLPAFQTMGLKRADAVITSRDVRNVPQSIRVALQATAVTPLMNVLPATVYFYARPGSGGFASAQRAAILTNDGPVAFQRTGVTIEGPHAAEFRVLGGEYGVGASDLSHPLTVESGGAEFYRMGFYPTTTGTREATLRIDTNEGQMYVALRGACDQGCQQPPVIQINEPPPPVALVPVKVVYPKVKIRKLKQPKAPPPATKD